MKVLVIGGGAREHAIAWKVSQSAKLTKLYCLPGNPGTAQFATNVELPLSNLHAVALWAADEGIELTIVGPEAPLAAGIVNVFSERGLKIFGPTQEAARLESSKSFAKEVMLKAGVKTAKGQVFTDINQARAYAEQEGAPLVIKADGLAAGKGVVVAETVEEALAALQEFMVDGTLGSAGTSVVIEEKLDGQEASVMAIIDGESVIPLVVSQDYKRLLDGGQGPNTGGMGAISPAPALADSQLERMVADIFVPVVREMWSRGVRYSGFLYAGVMIDRSGTVHVLEFNCRLGDPETQVLMLRLQSDLLQALNAAVLGRLSSIELSWTNQAAACVVAASAGYPKEVRDGKVITGLPTQAATDLAVFHAGTVVDKGDKSRILSKGGRVLTVAALGATTQAAAERAYEALGQISFEGMQFRRDIG